jgi:hypothetical protein
MQTILSTTINELRRVTGARKTQIRVGISPDATVVANSDSQDKREA